METSHPPEIKTYKPNQQKLTYYKESVDYKLVCSL